MAANPDYQMLYKRARALAGMTQAELAAELGIGLAKIKRTETGQRTPLRAEVIAVAVVTGLPLSFFGEDAAASQLEALARIQQDLAQRPADTAHAPTPPTHGRDDRPATS